MRRWFFLLMILLLPLRGWVGDAMAMQMAVPGPHAPATGVMQHHADAGSDAAHAQASSVTLASADDCGGHVNALGTDDDMDAAHCEACAMCQTCHTVAVLLLPQVLAAAQVSPTSPPAAMQVFASADRALLLKPPIH